MKTGRDYNAQFQTRAEEDRRYIEGYFVRFDDTYVISDKIVETIDPQAFRNLNNHDLVSLWNHNSDYPLGRSAAKTARFEVHPEKGVWGSVEINQNDPMAVGAHARVERGDVPFASFGFNIEDEEIIQRSDGVTEFRLKLVDAHEFSPCTFPAYKGTAIAARSEQLADMEKRNMQAQKTLLKARLENIAKDIEA